MGRSVHVFYSEIPSIYQGEEGQPQQFLVRATFSSFSRPSHLEILVLPIYFFKCLILQDKTIFWESRATKGHKWNIEYF